MPGFFRKPFSCKERAVFRDTTLRSPAYTWKDTNPLSPLPRLWRLNAYSQARVFRLLADAPTLFTSAAVLVSYGHPPGTPHTAGEQPVLGG